MILKEGKVILRDLGGDTKTCEVDEEIAKKFAVP